MAQRMVAVIAESDGSLSRRKAGGAERYVHVEVDKDKVVQFRTCILARFLSPYFFYPLHQRHIFQAVPSIYAHA